MTITSPEQTGVTPELSQRGRRVADWAKEYASGWGKLTQFFADNPDIANRATPHNHYVLVYLSPSDNPAALLAEYARRGMRAGARIEKDYDDEFGKVLLHFGPVYLQVYSDRAEVCERVVVGTREVIEEVQDPEALAAVPTITQTRTEEIVRWECKPLLAADQAEAVSA